MKYYVDSKGNYLGAWDIEGPSDGISVTPPPDSSDQIWQFPGWGPSLTLVRQVEDAWRSVEMPQARENRIAIAEMGDDSIPGTAKQWQDYWLALRDWKDGNPDYPDINKRPIKPS